MPALDSARARAHTLTQQKWARHQEASGGAGMRDGGPTAGRAEGLSTEYCTCARAMTLRMALAAAALAGSSAVPTSRLGYSACASSSTSSFCATSPRNRSEETASLLQWLICQPHLLYINREATLRWHWPPGSVISTDVACRSAHLPKTATSRRRTSSSPNALGER
jgi:hypothetical protein